MAAVAVSEEFELTTRNKYTHVDCEVSIKVNGKELPTAATLGAALVEAVELIQAKVTESYKVVPPRVGAPTFDEREASGRFVDPLLKPLG